MPSRSSRSNTDKFLGGLEAGRVMEAVKEVKPSHSSSGHHRQHHSTRDYDYYDEGAPRHSRYDEVYPEDDRYVDVSPEPPRHRSAHSDRYYDDGRSHHSHHRGHGHGHGSEKSSSAYVGPDLKQAAGAAVAAGAIEAFRSRNDADRTMRVATAALGAAATQSAMETTRPHKEKRHIVESAIAGLVENRAINGPRR
ncbi:hypothetical protein F4777DRAFT_581451 [Nemania sp. FL0916]|nr:hypothetical protein F4777DRAFT_581451 [Nemania sp. FL0916]